MPSEIGFADGEILSYRKEANRLTLAINAWNDRRIGVIFDEVLRFCDFGGVDISNVVELSGDTEFLKNAVRRAYDSPPEPHGFRHFQVLAVDEACILEIVAKTVQVI